MSFAHKIFCNKRFWKDFSPRYCGVYFIMLLTLLNLLYTVVYVIMAVYFDTFSTVQFLGYLTLLIGNIIVFVTGILTIHFLSQRPSSMKLSYFVFIHVAMIVAGLLGVASIILMLIPPSPDEMIAYTKKNVQVYQRAVYMIGQIFIEKKCCGIKEQGDVFPNFYYRTEGESELILYYRIPATCCQKHDKLHFNKCVETAKFPVNHSTYEEYKEKYLYPNGCLSKGADFSELQKTTTYQMTYMATVYGMFGVFLFIFGIFAVLNYYVWYRFPRAPKYLRPINFNEDLRNFVKCKCGKLRRSLKERKEAEKEKIAVPYSAKDAAPSDFVLRHELIKQSLAGMRMAHSNKNEEDNNKRLGSGSSINVVSQTDSLG